MLAVEKPKSRSRQLCIIYNENIIPIVGCENKTKTDMLYEKISGDIVAAMKAKDKVRLMALRSVKKYFLEATMNSPMRLPSRYWPSWPSRVGILLPFMQDSHVRTLLMRSWRRWLSSRSICPSS